MHDEAKVWSFDPKVSGLSPWVKRRGFLLLLRLLMRHWLKSAKAAELQIYECRCSNLWGCFYDVHNELEADVIRLAMQVWVLPMFLGQSWGDMCKDVCYSSAAFNNNNTVYNKSHSFLLNSLLKQDNAGCITVCSDNELYCWIIHTWKNVSSSPSHTLEP